MSRLGFLDVVSRKGVTVVDYAQNGNLDTLTPLIMNAFMPAGLTFWEEYIRRSGIDFCIKRLEFFLECIRNGDGKKAANVLKQGLIEFDCEGM